MIDCEINKPSSWNGSALPGKWQVTLKVDGVRAIWHDDRGWLSRANKELHNIPPWKRGPRDCEVYVNSFQDTIRATRTKYLKPDTPVIKPENLFGLDPLDARLDAGWLNSPSAHDVLAELTRARSLGYEGLVLRQGKRWVKVKPEETHDVAITGFCEGEGKHIGRLGLVTTERGNVGIGFSDEERVALWAEANAGSLVGQVIEVSCMMTSSTGKFRHPSFVRMRPDKLAV